MPEFVVKDYLIEMDAGSVAVSILSSGPLLVGWIIAVILATIILKRGGGRAERFLLSGTSLMLLQSFITALTPYFVTLLTVGRGMTNVEIASVLGLFNLVRAFIGLAGIICLVYAFWVKFKLH